MKILVADDDPISRRRGEREDIGEGFEAGADDYMTKPFKKEVSRAERYETPLAVIMADIDRFKDTNDRYGHPAGDKVLAEVARRLRTSLRVSDSIGRYGGEEFVIVAPGCTANSAALPAERFRLTISSQPIVLEREEIHVTMSFGVAATFDLASADDLLRAADEALYRAKNGGRNRVKITGQDAPP
jgi:two-component system cell cycle response regulator